MTSDPDHEPVTTSTAPRLDGWGPLSGYTIAITAARRREEFQAALERRGASVISAPAIQIVPVEDDSELFRITEQALAEPPDVVVATTGIGFRSWMDAAEGWGMGERLVAALNSAELLARGPKVRGAMRAAGLKGEWSPASESISEVLERLLSMDLRGRRVLVQEHGEPLPDVVDALRGAGADVVEVTVYRWIGPADPAPLGKLCRQISGGLVDAVAFTSAPAAASFLHAAQQENLLEQVLTVLRGPVLPVAVGPVTAAPLERAGLTVLQPERARLGALVREIESEIPRRLGQRLTAAGHALDIRARGVQIDEMYVPLAATAMALLRLLAARPGAVVPRVRLADALAAGADDHAVEVAVGRLRTALGDPRIVQTVVKRGYRLAFDGAGEQY